MDHEFSFVDIFAQGDKLVKHYPKKEIIICGNLDQRNRGNLIIYHAVFFASFQNVTWNKNDPLNDKNVNNQMP